MWNHLEPFQNPILRIQEAYKVQQEIILMDTARIYRRGLDRPNLTLEDTKQVQPPNPLGPNLSSSIPALSDCLQDAYMVGLLLDFGFEVMLCSFVIHVISLHKIEHDSALQL